MQGISVHINSHTSYDEIETFVYDIIENFELGGIFDDVDILAANMIDMLECFSDDYVEEAMNILWHLGEERGLVVTATSEPRELGGILFELKRYFQLHLATFKDAFRITFFSPDESRRGIQDYFGLIEEQPPDPEDQFEVHKITTETIKDGREKRRKKTHKNVSRSRGALTTKFPRFYD